MIVILFVTLLSLVYLPQLWVRRVMKKHQRDQDSMPGTGGELATHLLKRFGMDEYQVEETQPWQDHFSPTDKTVRLSPNNFNGKSLTAIAVATHEVGHAIQHHKQETVFRLRARYIPLAKMFEQTGLWMLRLLPILIIVLKVPAFIAVYVGVSLLFQLIGALVYLIVLPEEWDASFNKALPILMQGEYIDLMQESAVRQVLKAAALTYFAGALASILNITRLFLLFRR